MSIAEVIDESKENPQSRPNALPQRGPMACPVCGQPSERFDLGTSSFLDWIETIASDLHALKRCVEETLL